MPGILATTIVNDGLNAAIVSGVLTMSASTQATGPFSPTSVLLDSVTATTMATIKKVNTTALAGDTALVVAVRDGTVTAIVSGTITAQISGGTSFISGGTVTAVVSGTTVVSGTVTAVISGTATITAGSVTASLNQAGAAISTTNGLWANVMFNNAIVSAGAGLPVNIVSGSVTVGNVTSALNQGGAALSSTNGIYANLLFNNTLVSASVGLPVNVVAGAFTATLNQGGSALGSTNGLPVNIFPVRSLRGNVFTTVNSTTQLALIPAVSTAFIDVYGVIIENTSSNTAVTVTFRNVTAATPSFEITVPGNDTRGFMLPSQDAYKQTAQNTTWTLQCSTAVASTVISVLYVLNQTT